jgi:hypothetical protein
MPQRLKSVAALALALALASVSAAAAAQEDSRTVEASYYVHAKGIRAGEFTFRFTQNGETYEASAERRITGPLRALAGSSQDYEYSVEGTVEAGRLTPSYYRHSGGRRGRVVEASFTPDDIVTTADPPMGMGEPPATQEQKQGAVDQLTAIAEMIIAQGEICARTLPVYMDGRSRFDFVMHPDGEENVNNRAYRGPVQRCVVDYVPIAGFGDPQEPAELTFLFAPTPSGMNAPVSIEMPTDDAGIIRLEARKMFLDGVPLRD